MTGTTIIQVFEDIVDDQSLSDTFKLQLMNSAKDEYESLRPWEHLKVLSTALSTSASDTYTTAKSLPSDFVSPINVYIGDDRIPYVEIPFSEKQRYRDLNRRYAIDYANSKLHLMGTHTGGQTVYVNYIKQTPDITASTSPLFVARFHPVLAYRMAALFFDIDIDTDNVTSTLAGKWMGNYRALKMAMENHDDAIKARVYEGAVPMPQYETYPNIVY